MLLHFTTSTSTTGFKSALLVLALSCYLPSFSQGHHADSSRSDKNLRFSILGGPGYSPDFGLLIGADALFTFSTDRQDSTLKRSVVPVIIAYFTKGGGSVFIRPQLFFNQDRFRVFGQFAMSNNLDNYYGVGYELGSTTPRGSETTQYRNLGYTINPVFLFKIGSTQLFAGPEFDIGISNINDPATGILMDPTYIEEGGTADGSQYFMAGLGLNFNLDTRGVPANAYQGVFASLKMVHYNEAIGSDYTFTRVDLNYAQYKSLPFIGERKTLAWTVKTSLTNGNVPLTDLARIGSAFDLRGYYLGQYRDNHSFASVVEYRHMFNTQQKNFWQRMAHRLGFVTWFGLGSVAPEISDWSQLLLNIGAGARFEVQPRMNFRVDIGHSLHDGHTLIYFNMTEAF